MQAVVTAPRAAQTHNLHRAGRRFGVAFVLARLRALGHRWCPRPDQQPLSGCVGRDVLAGACAPTPGPAGAVPVRVRSRSSAGLRWTRGRLWHPRRQHRPLRTGLASGDRCKGRRFGARRMYVPGILSSQPSQVCLPSHGTVPERRANVQKGARLSGRRPKVFGAVTRLGWLPERRRHALACSMSPPEMTTGETHSRAKEPMNRAKNPLRKRAAPTGFRPAASLRDSDRPGSCRKSSTTWLEINHAVDDFQPLPGVSTGRRSSAPARCRAA